MLLIYDGIAVNTTHKPHIACHVVHKKRTDTILSNDKFLPSSLLLNKITWRYGFIIDKTANSVVRGYSVDGYFL